MQKPELLETLGQLHAELGKGPQIDSQTAQALRVLMADIHRLIDSGPPDQEEDMPSLQQRLKDAMLRFETEHPSLTAVLGRLADGLANMGV
jgi:hypothetical protein